ncbi:MAG TPA: NF038122 family metalloprotease [Stellaceae bacterium]|nr:NF038122 family metalloprotease [Stellaceae bacterium]
MIINIVYDSSTSGAPAGFFTAVNAAVDFWERELVNPIAVTIHFGWGEVNGSTIGGGALAESVERGISANFAAVTGGLSGAATSANDMTSVSHLPGVDPTSGAGFFVTLAEAEVLGLFSTTPNTLVGFAGLNSNEPFTYDPLNRGTGSDFDAIGAMEHEISEVLGRIAGSGQTPMGGGTAEFSPLDLFRYVSPGVLAVTPEAASFSIDGGAHMLLPFNDPTGGDDAGDWGPSVNGDSFGEGSPGTAGLVSPTDLEVMDVLGYVLAPDPNARNDFNADGKSDFLIRETSGQMVVGEVNSGPTSYTAISSLGSDWTFEGNGDFLGHGRTDVLVKHTSGVMLVGEVVNGQATYTQVSSLGSTWGFEGTGAFLDDGKEGFLVNDSNSGTLLVGEVSGGQAVYTAIGNLKAPWTFQGTGNFLGDGKTGFLIQDAALGGVIFVGEVVNGQAAYTQVATLGTAWKFVETGNFLGDGKSDFLVQDAALGGVILAGEVTGGHAVYTQIASLGSEWKFVGSGDYFGEGHDQFLIQDTLTGAVLVGDWNGSQTHYTQVSSLGADWTFH